MANLEEFLADALAKGRRKIRGQRTGPIVPRPRALAVCDKCTDTARRADPDAIPQGVPLRRLGRHLREFHGWRPGAVAAALKGLR